MSRLPRMPRRLIHVMTALVIGIAAGGTQVASASAGDSGKNRHRGCTVIENVTEQTIRWESIGQGGEAMKIGDYATYYDNLYDPADKVIGNVVGHVSAVANSPTQGHVRTIYNEGIILPQGSVRTSGLVDRYMVLSGQTVKLAAYGLSGSVANKVGYREAQIIVPDTPPQDPSHIRVRLKLVLC